jgi:hypothetical protein
MAKQKKHNPDHVKSQLGPGSYIKYSDMTMWDKPGEGGPDLYIFAPAVTEDELMNLEQQHGQQPSTVVQPPSEPQ